MSRFTKYFKSEFIGKLFSSKKKIIKFIAISFVPFLYGFVCIYAFWNPVGEIGAVPMAIVDNSKRIDLVIGKTADHKVVIGEASDNPEDFDEVTGLPKVVMMKNLYGKELIKPEMTWEDAEYKYIAISECDTYIKNYSFVESFLRGWGGTGNTESVISRNENNTFTINLNEENQLHNVAYFNNYNGAPSYVAGPNGSSGVPGDVVTTNNTRADTIANYDPNMINTTNNTIGAWKVNNENYWLQIQIPTDFNDIFANVLTSMYNDKLNLSIDPSLSPENKKLLKEQRIANKWTNQLDQLKNSPINIWTTFKKNFLFGQFMKVFNELKSSMVIDFYPRLITQTMINVISDVYKSNLQDYEFTPSQDATITFPTDGVPFHNGTRGASKATSKLQTYNLKAGNAIVFRNDEIKAAVANNLDAQGLSEDAASVRNVKTYEGNTTNLTSDGGDWEVTANGSYIDTVESIITPVLDALITPTPTPDEPTVEEPTTYVAQLMSDETSQPSARGSISFEVLTKYLENKMFLTSFFERDFGSPNLYGTWDTGSMPVKQIYEDMDSTVANLVKILQNKSDFSTLFGAPTNFIEKINLANANNKITPKKSSLTADEFAKITPENLLSKIKIDGISKSDMKNLEVIDFSATSPSITFKISSYGAISDPITVSWTVDGTAPAPTPTPSPDVVLINKINTAIAEKGITPKAETITSAQFDEISADNILDKVDIKGITNKDKTKLNVIDFNNTNKPTITFKLAPKTTTRVSNASNLISITWKIEESAPTPVPTPSEKTLIEKVNEAIAVKQVTAINNVIDFDTFNGIDANNLLQYINIQGITDDEKTQLSVATDSLTKTDNSITFILQDNAGNKTNQATVVWTVTPKELSIIQKINNGIASIQPIKSDIDASQFATITEDTLIENITLPADITPEDKASLHVSPNGWSKTSNTITFKLTANGEDSDLITCTWNVTSLIDVVNNNISAITPNTDTIFQSDYNGITNENLLSKITIPNISSKEKKLLTVKDFSKESPNKVKFTLTDGVTTSNEITVTFKVRNLIQEVNDNIDQFKPKKADITTADFDAINENNLLWKMTNPINYYVEVPGIINHTTELGKLSVVDLTKTSPSISFYLQDDVGNKSNQITVTWNSVTTELSKIEKINNGSIQINPDNKKVKDQATFDGITAQNLIKNKYISSPQLNYGYLGSLGDWKDLSVNGDITKSGKSITFKLECNGEVSKEITVTYDFPDTPEAATFSLVDATTFANPTATAPTTPKSPAPFADVSTPAYVITTADEWSNYISNIGTSLKSLVINAFPKKPHATAPPVSEATPAPSTNPNAPQPNTELITDGVIGDGDLAVYGIGLGQFFLFISVWVGVLMLTFVLDRKRRGDAAKPELLSQSEIYAKKKVTRWIRFKEAFAWYGSKIMTMIIMVTIQVTILCLTLYALGYYVMGITFLWLYLQLLFSGWVFAIFIGSLWMFFRDDVIGKFIAILFLIVNLSSGWGTFPPYMQAPIFQWLSYIAPFTYSIKNIGAIVYGIGVVGNNWQDISFILGNIGISLIYAVIGLVIGMFGCMRLTKMQFYGSRNKKKLATAIMELNGGITIEYDKQGISSWWAPKQDFQTCYIKYKTGLTHEYSYSNNPLISNKEFYTTFTPETTYHSEAIAHIDSVIIKVDKKNPDIKHYEVDWNKLPYGYDKKITDYYNQRFPFDEKFKSWKEKHPFYKEIDDCVL